MQISHVAKLASLSLTPEEELKFDQQLTQTIQTVKSINQLDTSEVNPTSQVTSLTNISRPDTVDPQRILSPDQALSNTSKHRNGFFLVPAIFDHS